MIRILFNIWYFLKYIKNDFEYGFKSLKGIVISYIKLFFGY